MMVNNSHLEDEIKQLRDENEGKKRSENNKQLIL